jgi:hypothetical protein
MPISKDAEVSRDTEGSMDMEPRKDTVRDERATQSEGRNITRTKIEEGASAAGNSVDEQDRVIADAADLPKEEVKQSPRQAKTPTADSEARATEKMEVPPAALQDGDLAWGPDGWTQIRRAITARWPGVAEDAFANVEPRRSALLEELKQHVFIDAQELERELDLLISNYAVEGSRDDPGVVLPVQSQQP